MHRAILIGSYGLLGVVASVLVYFGVVAEERPVQAACLAAAASAVTAAAALTGSWYIASRTEKFQKDERKLREDQESISSQQLLLDRIYSLTFQYDIARVQSSKMWHQAEEADRNNDEERRVAASDMAMPGHNAATQLRTELLIALEPAIAATTTPPLKALLTSLQQIVFGQDWKFPKSEFAPVLDPELSNEIRNEAAARKTSLKG
jgi:hypothetical protein